VSYAGIDLIDLANAAFKIADLPWHSAVHTHAPDSLKSIKLTLTPRWKRLQPPLQLRVALFSLIAASQVFNYLSGD